MVYELLKIELMNVLNSYRRMSRRIYRNVKSIISLEEGVEKEEEQLKADEEKGIVAITEEELNKIIKSLYKIDKKLFDSFDKAILEENILAKKVDEEDEELKSTFVAVGKFIKTLSKISDKKNLDLKDEKKIKEKINGLAEDIKKEKDHFSEKVRESIYKMIVLLRDVNIDSTHHVFRQGFFQMFKTYKAEQASRALKWDLPRLIKEIGRIEKENNEVLKKYKVLINKIKEFNKKDLDNKTNEEIKKELEDFVDSLEKEKKQIGDEEKQIEKILREIYLIMIFMVRVSFFLSKKEHTLEEYLKHLKELDFSEEILENIKKELDEFEKYLEEDERFTEEAGKKVEKGKKNI